MRSKWTHVNIGAANIVRKVVYIQKENSITVHFARGLFGVTLAWGFIDVSDKIIKLSRACHQQIISSTYVFCRQHL